MIIYFFLLKINMTYVILMINISINIFNSKFYFLFLFKRNVYSLKYKLFEILKILFLLFLKMKYNKDI